MRGSFGAALAVALLAAGAPAAVAAPRPACVAYTDATGDSGLLGVTAFDDPALDVTRVRFPMTARAWVAEVTLARFADRGRYLPGVRVEVAFPVAPERKLSVFWRTSPARDVERPVFYQQGILLNGLYMSGDVTARVTGDTVVLTTTPAALSAVAGRRLDGLRPPEVVVKANGHYLAGAETWDEARAPVPFVIGRACR
ncbi:MAG TPA: hypothetical protein VF519_13925 [Mycobacteriales bacterium]|jgi:hypothetical protein